MRKAAVICLGIILVLAGIILGSFLGIFGIAVGGLVGAALASYCS